MNIENSSGLFLNSFKIKKIYSESFKISVLILVFALATSNINAQQEVMLTQSASGLQLTNPAYVGTSGRLNAIGIIRNQWLGFEGAPKSHALLFNTPLLQYHLGVGLTMLRDEIGPESKTEIDANVAYNFKFNDKIRISMGLNGGYTINKVDNNSLSPLTTNDPTYYEPNQIQYIPNMGAGLYIYSPVFYCGISVPKLLKTSYKQDLNQSVEATEQRHLYMIGGYLFNLSELWKAKPSFSCRIVKGSPVSVDVTANAIYKEKFWFGAMYRFGDAYGFIFQYQISSKLRAGYSYDLPITEMRKGTTGSHEIFISYDLLFKDRRNASPRYF